LRPYLYLASVPPKRKIETRDQVPSSNEDPPRMAATVRVVCGPAGSGKTERLLERCRAAAREGVGTALWLGPTRRAVDAVRGRLPRGGGVLAPHLLTFQDFADAVVSANDPAARPLSAAQRRLLADDLVTELHQRGELPHFDRVAETRGFAEGVAGLLAELKRN